MRDGHISENTWARAPAVGGRLSKAQLDEQEPRLREMLFATAALVAPQKRMIGSGDSLSTPSARFLFRGRLSAILPALVTGR